MEQNITVQLKDIKPLLVIPDSSYYIYWGVILLLLVLIVGIVFFVLKTLWERRKYSLERGYLESIKKIDWVDTKKSAYAATYYARLLATDERRRELFSQLQPMLEQYKYKKKVNHIDKETHNKFNLYVQVADESI